MGAWVARQLGRPVIEAFNNIFSKRLLENGRPEGTTGRVALPSLATPSGAWKGDAPGGRTRLRPGGRAR